MSPARAPAANARPPRPPSPHFTPLSGLRGLAALLVLVRHLDAGAYICGWRGFGELGVFAVWVFFVLSAFLLTFRALQDDIPLFGSSSPSPHPLSLPRRFLLSILPPFIYWTKYLIRRFTRVWPLYASIVFAAHIWPSVIVRALWGAFPPGSSIWASLLMRDKLDGREMGQFWSLRPEFAYYLVLPVYVVLWKVAERLDGVHVVASPAGAGRTHQYAWNRWTWRSVWLGGTLGTCILLAWLDPLSLSAHQNQRLPPYIPVFYSGTLGAVFLHLLLQLGFSPSPSPSPSTSSPAPATSHRWRLSLSTVQRWAGDILCLFLLALIVASDDWYHTLLFRRPPANHFWSWGPLVLPSGAPHGPSLGWAAGPLVVSLILSLTVLSPRGLVARFLSVPLLVRAGEISFSLYALHPIFGLLSSMHLPPPDRMHGVDRFAATLIICWIGAEATFRGIERVGMKAGTIACGWVGRAGETVEKWVMLKGEGYEKVEMGELEIA